MNPIKIHSQTFHLHPTGAAFWKEKDALLIADVHFGKISHFRKYGSAIPEQAIQKNFERLNRVIANFQPQQLIFLGDLFHSALNQEWALFEAWQKEQSAKITLISGNHDIISPQKYKNLGIAVLQDFNRDNFRLTHHPEARDENFNICGHIHPGYRLKGQGKQHMKLRCFFQRQNQLILPAFGAFTGNYYLKPQRGEKVFLCAETTVIAV